MHPRSREDDFLNNVRPVPVVVQQEKWTGWDLNPRPQQAFPNIAEISSI